MQVTNLFNTTPVKVSLGRIEKVKEVARIVSLFKAKLTDEIVMEALEPHLFCRVFVNWEDKLKRYIENITAFRMMSSDVTTNGFQVKSIVNRIWQAVKRDLLTSELGVRNIYLDLRLFQVFVDQLRVEKQIVKRCKRGLREATSAVSEGNLVILEQTLKQTAIGARYSERMVQLAGLSDKRIQLLVQNAANMIIERVTKVATKWTRFTFKPKTISREVSPFVHKWPSDILRLVDTLTEPAAFVASRQLVEIRRQIVKVLPGATSLIMKKNGTPLLSPNQVFAGKEAYISHLLRITGIQEPDAASVTKFLNRLGESEEIEKFVKQNSEFLPLGFFNVSAVGAAHTYLVDLLKLVLTPESGFQLRRKLDLGLPQPYYVDTEEKTVTCVTFFSVTETLELPQEGAQPGYDYKVLSKSVSIDDNYLLPPLSLDAALSITPDWMAQPDISNYVSIPVAITYTFDGKSCQLTIPRMDVSPFCPASIVDQLLRFKD